MFLLEGRITNQVERRVKLEGLLEHYQTNLKLELTTVWSPRVNCLVTVVLERPGFEGISEPTEDICHRKVSL